MEILIEELLEYVAATLSEVVVVSAEAVKDLILK